MSGLEKITHVCLIAVSCVSLGLLLEKRFAASGTTSISRGAQIGRPLTLNGVSWSSSPKSVVIALRSGCKYCAASLPFYRQISDIRRQHGPGFAVFAVSSDPSEITRAYLTKAGIVVDQVLQSDFETIGVRGTPTVFIVDARGMVKTVFTGQLQDSGQRKLLAMLDNSTDTVRTSEK